MIVLTKGTNRNTPAHTIEIGDHTLFFSYQTLVGLTGRNREGVYQRLVVENRWGPTTGRHMKEMGLRGDYFEVVTEEDMQARAADALRLNDKRKDDTLIAVIQDIIEDCGGQPMGRDELRRIITPYI